LYSDTSNNMFLSSLPSTLTRFSIKKLNLQETLARRAYSEMAFPNFIFLDSRSRALQSSQFMIERVEDGIG
jgi:hypothetical protein